MLIVIFSFSYMMLFSTHECYFYVHWQDDSEDDEDFDIPDLRERLAKHNIHSSPEHSAGMFNHRSTLHIQCYQFTSN